MNKIIKDFKEEKFTVGELIKYGLVLPTLWTLFLLFASILEHACK